MPQHDVTSYASPGKPNRQLTKDDLGPYGFQLLNAIESVANSLPYLGNEVFRNDLILDNELKTSTALTCFFLDGGVVTEVQPGFNLLRDEYAWKRVPNNVFFNAIRMAWNYFSRRGYYGQGGTFSASSEQRNADVVPSSWYPQAHLYPQDRMRMTFLHSEVLDIRARARQLNKLLNWEEEGTVVEHWIENCSMQKKPSRLAFGRYLKRIWQRELDRQKAIKQSKPTFAYKWQPPGPELHLGN